MLKLKENQLALLSHLAQFEILDYLSCLRLLNGGAYGDRKELSYAFRPLTKYKYAKLRKDNNVVILAKGRALFPEREALITLGGGTTGIRRAVSVSRTAMFLNQPGIDVPSQKHPDETDNWCFIPSACWRNIRDGILSTTRFTGILFLGKHRLAVYDIGDGSLEWQMRAERSLFYRRYDNYETKATGMLFLCDDSKREEIACKIIRTTMWNRKQLLGKNSMDERERPVKYVHAPIKLNPYYEHVYLSSPSRLASDLKTIEHEDDYIDFCRREFSGEKLHEPKSGDFECWPYRYFINSTTDLLKYVYYFAACKSLLAIRKEHDSELSYGLIFQEWDAGILTMYEDVLNMEGAEFYVCQSSKNDEKTGA